MLINVDTNTEATNTNAKVLNCLSEKTGIDEKTIGTNSKGSLTRTSLNPYCKSVV